MPILVIVPKNYVSKYCYEGVQVVTAPYNEIYKEIHSFQPDIIFIMGGYDRNRLIASCLRKILPCPMCLFLIGSDCLYTPLFYPIESLRKIPKRMLISEFIKMLRLRRFLRQGDERGDFVIHPSNWQKVACEKSAFYKARNVRIIPFPVDTTIFKFQPRQGRVEKLICVRPHKGRKYGLDLVIKASRSSKYETHLYGTGPLLYKHMALARRLGANVKFFPQFFSHLQLAEIYLRYDMGFMPSRIDSQGVSACEMQATGLPVITSPIRAIPEFATEGTILIKNKDVDKVEGILDEINDKRILEELSYKAHKGIVEKCGIEMVMKEHLLLISQMLKKG